MFAVFHSLYTCSPPSIRWLSVLVLCIASGAAYALPADFVEEDLFQEQARMIGLEFLPDGRMLAFRKTG